MTPGDTGVILSTGDADDFTNSSGQSNQSTNTIRIAVADVSDSSYDSNLLIAGNSVQTQVIAITDSTNLYPNGSKDLDVLTNDINGGGGSLTITHLNGQPVTVGVPILLNTGQTISLDANGTVNILGDGDVEDFNFTYTIDNGTNTDIGFVSVSSIPCFVAGTMIATQQVNAVLRPYCWAILC